MSEDTKNLGFRKPCGECRKPLVTALSFSGNGVFEIKCPHCQCLNRVEFKQKNSVTIVRVLTIFIIVMTVNIFFSMEKIKAVDAQRCSDFGTRGEAQHAFNQNPEKYYWMDRDNDIQACENLPINLKKQ